MSINEVRKPRLFVALDLECTGLDSAKHGICQIGAWATGEGEDDFRDYFVSDANPHHATAQGERRVEVSLDALRVNGFTQERIDRSLSLSVVLWQFSKWLTKRKDNYEIVIVGQNVPFDVAWLIKDFRRNGLDVQCFRRVIDNASLGFAVYGELMGQGKLADRLGIINAGAHDALADAYTASKIFHRLRAKLAPAPNPLDLTPFTNPNQWVQGVSLVDTTLYGGDVTTPLPKPTITGWEKNGSTGQYEYLSPKSGGTPCH